MKPLHPDAAFLFYALNDLLQERPSETRREFASDLLDSIARHSKTANASDPPVNLEALTNLIEGWLDS